MANISKSESKKLLKKVKSLQSRAKNAVGKMEDVVEEMTRTAEAGSAAFLTGVAQGKWGSTEVMGVPAELLVGAGTKAIAFAVGGNMAPHLHAFGQGALDGYLSGLGRGIGLEWKAAESE